jgi:PAS domain S-box-containing protein
MGDDRTDGTDRSAFERLFALAPDLMCIADVDGYFKVVNPAFASLGYTREELLSQPFLEFVHAEDRRTASAQIEKLRLGIPMVAFETRMVRKDGTARSVVWNAIPDATGALYGVGHDVTERKQAESRNEQWARVFEHAGWGIAIGSADNLTFEAMNPEFRRMHGFSQEEPMSNALLDLYAPSERDRAVKAIEETYRRGHYAFETLHQRKDGSVFPVAIDSTPVRDASGRVLYRAVHVQDLTKWREAERLTLDANRFLEAVIEYLPNMVFVKDAERLAFVRFNRAGEELIGVPRAELIGKNDYDFFPKEQADFFQAKDRETLTNGVLVDIPEEPIETRNGRRLLHTRKVPILDADGRPSYLLGISEDITDRRAGDEARARLAAIVDDSDDAIIGVTLDGIITSWNGGAQRMFGYTAEEMIGQSKVTLFPEARGNEDADVIERILRGERVPNFETLRTRKDGTELDVSVGISPVRDPTGRIVGMSKIVRDITSLKRTQRELVRAREHAELVSRELESFSYSVAHDLRAPLRSIDGFSQAIIEDYAEKLDDEGRRYLRFIRESAQLMARLIDDMLRLSRVTRAELHHEPVDLSTLVRTAIERLRFGEPKRRVEVVIQPDVVVAGDPRLLAVVIDNLIGNAWKFSSKRELAHIEFGTVPYEGRFACFVRDNGAGFDMKYADKLFGVFQRLHGAEEFEGTGVGLATVQRIIHRHNGRLWAEAEVDKGATFLFTVGDGEAPAST